MTASRKHVGPELESNLGPLNAMSFFFVVVVILDFGGVGNKNVFSS